MSDDLILPWFDHVSRALARDAGPILSFVVTLNVDDDGSSTVHIATIAVETATPLLADPALIPHFQAIADAIGVLTDKLVRELHPDAKSLVVYRHVDDAPPARKRRKKP